MTETVEEFLARGGEIQQIPMGLSANLIKYERSAGSSKNVWRTRPVLQKPKTVIPHYRENKG
jgi:hypothetical protein